MDMLKKYIGVLSIYFIVFSQMLDTSVANLSLMKIAPDLGIDVLHASWIMTSFGTGLIISFPIASILSKKYQPDAVFFYCSLGFILTSIGCGFGVGSLDFVFMRFVQGMTSGIVIILSQALMIRIMGEENKAFAMSLWVSAISLAPIFGPMLGAYITDQLGWRWIFFINVPIVGLCLIGLGNQVARVTDVKKDDKRVYASLFLFAISICCMQYVLDFGRQLGWLQSSAIITAIALAVLSFAVFLMVNSLRNYQIFDLSLFSNYNFTISAIIISIGNGLIFSSLIILPIWLQSDYKIPIITAGVVVSVGSLVAAIISPMIGKYVKPSQYLSFSVLSLFCLGVSFLMASQFALDTSMRYILLSRVFFGLGVASFTVPLTALSLSTLDTSQYISANSIIMTTRVLCANIATSLAFVYFTHRYYIEYELILSNLDRFSVTQEQSVEAMYPLVVSLARTETFQLEFLLHAVAFFVMGVTIYAINVISRKPAEEEGVVESA